jgi:DegV family protein with EDD domain
MTVKIITDSCCDIPLDLANELNITIVPVHIHFGTKDYLDGIDIIPNEFFKMIASSESFPTTSQPSVGQFIEEFKNSDNPDGILSIHVSSKVSGTFNAAKQASDQSNLSGPINIIDSLQVSITQGFAVMRAAAAAAAGKNLQEVSNIVQETCNRATMFGLIDTVDYLVKGGRLSKTAGLIGSLLNIKPIIVTRNGEVVQYAKTRSFTKSLRSISSKLESDSDLEEIGIMYTTDPIIATEFADSISDLLPNGKKPYISQLGSALGAHMGPGGLGVGIITK